MAITWWMTRVVCFVAMLEVSRGGRFGCQTFEYFEPGNEYHCRVENHNGKCDLKITQSDFKEIMVFGWRKGCQLSTSESVSNVTITLFGKIEKMSLIYNNGFNVKVFDRYGLPIQHLTLHPTSINMATTDGEKVC